MLRASSFDLVFINANKSACIFIKNYATSEFVEWILLKFHSIQNHRVAFAALKAPSACAAPLA